MRELTAEERGKLAAGKNIYNYGRAGLFKNPKTPFEHGYNSESKYLTTIAKEYLRLKPKLG